MPHPLPEISPPYSGPRPPVSIVILTQDESINIAGAIASCAWSDDVHVLDSGSRDNTVELARSAGAQVHTNPFESFGKQRNWAIDHLPLKHEWIFHLDADERFTPQLVEELAAILFRNPDESGFYVANQMILNGSWIKHASGYPAYQMRFFHKSRMRFEDHGHGQRESGQGKLGTLTQPYTHHNFSKGLDEWRKRHDRYSTLEANQILASIRSGDRPSLSALFSSNSMTRRRALKALASRIPFRAQARWLHTMFLKGAFLDGRAGLTYANLLYWYEGEIARKVAAGRRAQS